MTEVKVKKPVPVCPNCGAKFAHSKALGMCLKCKIPDEILAGGPNLVARWKRKTEGKKKHTTHHLSRSRNKHGRRGVKA